MTASLLDANVLIALVVEEHEFHDRAVRWAASADGIAVCPVVEGALLRFLVRLGEAPSTGTAVLEALHRHPEVEFWANLISYLDADLTRVTGHRQVTDAYLVTLAVSRGATLATFDHALSRTHLSGVELIP